jgi:hypothetical protein
MSGVTTGASQCIAATAMTAAISMSALPAAADGALPGSGDDCCKLQSPKVHLALDVELCGHDENGLEK